LRWRKEIDGRADWNGGISVAVGSSKPIGRAL